MFRNKLQPNLYLNGPIFTQENAFENVIYKMPVISSHISVFKCNRSYTELGSNLWKQGLTWNGKREMVEIQLVQNIIDIDQTENNCTCSCYIIIMASITQKQLKTHRCTFSTVITDVLMLKHLAISTLSSDYLFIVVGQVKEIYHSYREH